MKIIEKINKDRNDFFLFTYADFRKTSSPLIDPDYISDSGSRYWYRGTLGVYRESNHWGEVGSCVWYLNNRITTSNNKILFTGYARFSQFIPIDPENPFLVSVSSVQGDHHLYYDTYVQRNLNNLSLEDVLTYKMPEWWTPALHNTL